MITGCLPICCRNKDAAMSLYSAWPLHNKLNRVRSAIAAHGRDLNALVRRASTGTSNRLTQSAIVASGTAWCAASGSARNPGLRQYHDKQSSEQAIGRRFRPLPSPAASSRGGRSIQLGLGNRYRQIAARNPRQLRLLFRPARWQKAYNRRILHRRHCRRFEQIVGVFRRQHLPTRDRHLRSSGHLPGVLRLNPLPPRTPPWVPSASHRNRGESSRLPPALLAHENYCSYRSGRLSIPVSITLPRRYR